MLIDRDNAGNEWATWSAEDIEDKLRSDAPERKASVIQFVFPCGAVLSGWPKAQMLLEGEKGPDHG